MSYFLLIARFLLKQALDLNGNAIKIGKVFSRIVIYSDA